MSASNTSTLRLLTNAGVRYADVHLLVDPEAQLVEVGGSEAGPAVDYRGLDVRHARVGVDAGAVAEQGVGGADIVCVHDAVIALQRHDDPDIDAAQPGLDEFVEDFR